MAHVHLDDAFRGSPNGGALSIQVPARFSREVGEMPVRLVFLALCFHANERNLAWPSIKTLSEETSIAERKVRICLKVLEVNHLIVRVGKAVPRKSGVEYRVCTPSVEDIGEVTPKAESTEDRSRGRGRKSASSSGCTPSSTHSCTDSCTDSCTEACDEDQLEAEMKVTELRQKEVDRSLDEFMKLLERAGHSVPVGAHMKFLALANQREPRDILSSFKAVLQTPLGRSTEFDVKKWLEKKLDQVSVLHTQDSQ